MNNTKSSIIVDVILFGLLVGLHTHYIAVAYVLIERMKHTKTRTKYQSTQEFKPDWLIRREHMEQESFDYEAMLDMKNRFSKEAIRVLKSIMSRTDRQGNYTNAPYTRNKRIPSIAIDKT